jgi:Uri superfamily endonuclease
MEIPALPGHYVIAGRAPASFKVQKKSWGLITFPAGNYFYCGSAHGPGGLLARVNRHLNRTDKTFWHFDYIKNNLNIDQVWWQVNQVNLECETAQFIAALPNTHIPLEGFGASDCRKGCRAHLICFHDTAVKIDVFAALNKNGWNYRQLILADS